MKKSTKILIAILICGVIYSFIRLFSGSGGSGLYDFFDALVYSSIAIFISALSVFILNIKKIKKHLDTFIFLLISLPLTIIAIQSKIYSIHSNRMPDLSIKYERPVDREQYLFDSANIKIAIDSMIALRNRQYGGPDVLYGVIDTIIYSQKGDKIFVSYMKKFEPNDLGNDLDPDYFGANRRDSVFWQLTSIRYSMCGSFHDPQSLKLTVRKFYFNKFSFLDKDSASANYFWKVVLKN